MQWMAGSDLAAALCNFSFNESHSTTCRKLSKMQTIYILFISIMKRLSAAQLIAVGMEVDLSIDW